MKLHKSITTDRILDSVQQSMFDHYRIGVCIACGEDSDDCDPDTEGATCEYCGKRAVIGWEQLVLRVAK